MIGQTVSHYRILGLLGEGGMGAVYAAEDTRLGRRVAIKIPHAAPAADNSFHARFLREARSVSQLSHPNIATVFDFGETGEGQPFIVMELVEGRELGDLLREEGLTLERALEIVCEVGEALSEAHLRGVVHRDVKPSNVVINSRGAVKVLDFGLAKIVSGGQHAASTPEAETLMKFRTRSDMLLGTPLYLSPEQARGAEVDARSDLFALGALLYECVTGRPAFSGATVMEIAAQILHVHPPPPSALNPDVPAELDRVAMKALAKQPEERYQSAGEMVEDLRGVRARLAGRGGAATAAAPGDAVRTVAMAARPATGARVSAIMTLSDTLRRPRLSLASLLVLLVVGVGAFWGIARITKGRAHEPLPEAERLAETGAEYLRDGAFWHASKALERAVEIDDRYALAHARLAEAWMEQDYSDRVDRELLIARQLVPDPSVLDDRDRLYFEAVTSTATRRFDEAARAYEEIARRWPEAPAAHVDLGRAYERREADGDFKRATDSYIEATRRDPKYATAYLRVGNLYARRQQYDSAAAAYDQAEAIYRERGLAEGRAEVHYRRGSTLRNRGMLADARAELQRSLDISRTNGYEAKQVNALLQLSAVEYAENNPDVAARRAREAIELAQSAGLENLVALGLVDLGNTFFARGEYAEAEKYLRQGLAFAERNKAHRVRARALINLGSLNIQRGTTDEGVPLVEQALALYRSGGHRKETLQALTILGRAQRQKGNYKEAVAVFEQQLQLAGQAGDPSQVALAHNEIGSVLLRQDDYPAALRHFDETYRIEKTLGHELIVGHALLSRSDALRSMGRLQEVPALLEEATALARKPGGGNKELLINVHLTTAEVALTQLRPDEARSRAAQALALAGEQNKRLAAKARLTLAAAQVRAGAAAAAAACEEALAAAKGVNDPALVSAAQLALAEALLRAGDAPRAASNALQAQEAFARAGRSESEWRAWLVAAGASRRAGDDEAALRYAERAAAALAALAEKWGAEVFASYQSRPDVQAWRRQLAEFSAGPRAS
jgi:tetratricopeptide (TPR) repeat protein/predicted Ser/Thr protein kinase